MSPEQIETLITQAVQQERERCAALALSMGEAFRVRHRNSYAEGYADASDTIHMMILKPPQEGQK